MTTRVLISSLGRHMAWKRSLRSMFIKERYKWKSRDIIPPMFFYKQFAFFTALAMLVAQGQAAPAVHERQSCTLGDATADDVAIGSCVLPRECKPVDQDARQRRALPVSNH